MRKKGKFSVSLTNEAHEAIVEIATSRGTTFSAIMESLARAYIEKVKLEEEEERLAKRNSRRH